MTLSCNSSGSSGTTLICDTANRSQHAGSPDGGCHYYPPSADKKKKGIEHAVLQDLSESQMQNM